MRIQKATERWFCCEGDPDNGKILVEHLSPEELRQIANACVETRVEYRPGNEEPVVISTPNRNKEEAMVLDRALKNWENFKDADGQPMKCNPRTKALAARLIPGFFEFFCECREKLAADLAKAKEDAEKNS